MAKVPFSKLQAVAFMDVGTAAYTNKSGEEIYYEVKKYLPIKEKLEMITRIVNLSVDSNGFYNPMRVKIYTTLEIVYTYTNLNFTDKMKEDPFRLYDILITSGIYSNIVDIIGGELKEHGLEKLGEVDLDSAIIKTGLLRHAKVTPRVISNDKPEDFIVSFLDHAGEDVYKYRQSSLVVTVGDDTTLISSDILYRFDIPIIGITDGDLDKVVEDGFKVKDSIIFEVESGFDDIVGQDIKKIIFSDKQESYDYQDIEEVKEKIVEIINNINCKYKINYIK